MRHGDRFILQPDLATWGYTPPEDAEPVPAGFAYRSDGNDEWYTREDITRILEQGV